MYNQALGVLPRACVMFDGVVVERLLIKLVYIKKCDFEKIKDLKVEPVWFIYGNYKNTLSESSDQKDMLINDTYITLISAVTGETIPIVSIGR